MSAKRNESDTRDREIVISRVIAAPRELVFDAFTDAKNIGTWWGPNGFRSTVHEMDVRPGGVWRYTMHGPDGKDWPNKVVYLEVVRPERLVYRHGTDGDVANDPHSFHVTISFAETAGKTTVTLHNILSSVEQLEAVKQFGAVEGGKQNLERLERYILQSKT